MIYEMNPIFVDAIQWNGNNQPELSAFAQRYDKPDERSEVYYLCAGTQACIRIGGMTHFVGVGDYLVKDGDSFYVLSQEVFEKLYHAKLD